MNKTILVIREFDKFSQILAKHGLEVINLPLIQTLPIENFDELDEKLLKLESYHGLFFTSPKAAQVFLPRFRKNGSVFRGNVYVLGRRTKSLFENTSLKLVFDENANTAEEFIKSFDENKFTGKKFLFVRGDRSLRSVPELLKNTAEIDEIIVYRTVENEIPVKFLAEIREKLHQRKIDWICFFSPSSVESFIGSFETKLLNSVKIAAIGTTTAEKAWQENLKADFVSPKANAEDFAVELIKNLGKLSTDGHKK
jgi:uroporphyrinogen III methyltransferase/synthase